MGQVVDRDERHVQTLIRNLRRALQVPTSAALIESMVVAALGDEAADPSGTRPLHEPAEALRTKYPDQPCGAIGRRFALLGQRPTLVARPDACAHCREYRGVRFNPMRAPLLPLEHCTSRRGCRCRYR